MIIAEEGASRTSTAIAGGAAKKNTEPMPILRAGDWILYTFQVLNSDEVVHFLT
jgi:hypothetical protein